MNDNILYGTQVEVDRSFAMPMPQKNEPARPETVQNDPATPVVTEKGQASFPGSESSAVVKNNSDVQLRFRMNEETKEMTVYIVDRASRKVIRTIPPDEVTKLNSGDLVELLA